MTASLDSYSTLETKEIDGKTYHFHNLETLGKNSAVDIHRLPYSLRVLLENLLRHEDGSSVKKADIEAITAWLDTHKSKQEIAFRPARVLMQDFTGVPGVVDLAAMRDYVARQGKDPELVNPLAPVDLVIDHSVMVDRFAVDSAYEDNVAIEMERNRERYEFLRWGQKAFDNFRVVPPGTGICHQVNLEYLGKSVWTAEKDGKLYAYPDTLVGTDSHTTMINGLGVLGWGVGGIEAEAAMLGQPISMLVPEVVGFRLEGRLQEGVTATDLVLTVTQMLREHGVVGKFVEFYGPGLDYLPLADRATIANMSPEYGATCGFFPIDQETLNYLELSGREPHTIKVVEEIAKAQGLWRSSDGPDPEYSSSLTLKLDDVIPCLAGPKRPQDRVALYELGRATRSVIELQGRNEMHSVEINGTDHKLTDGDVVIAAITSCTNTSNPAVMLAAGLVAKKAREKGLVRKPWVKTSLAPGSKVVTDYLEKAGLQDDLDHLGFNLVGYGCTTCIGNSGPLPETIEQAIDKGDLSVCSVLSGNRNFEGRIHAKIRANWLASPPLVVAFAIAGTTAIDLTNEPLAENASGEAIYLKDIWPSTSEITEAVSQVSGDMFRKRYADVFSGDEQWQSLPVPEGNTYQWQAESTYIQNPPFFTEASSNAAEVKKARLLALLGDSITTDHISPAGSIAEDSPAGRYLNEHGVEKKDFNSYGSRRGNHEVMMRGTFANVRIKNEMLDGVEGGYTRFVPGNEQMSIYDAAMKYQQQGTPLVVIAGKEYGTGSSRDWAAKGTRLLGVQAVIAESFERIHRSNLIGMGVLPLQFTGSDDRKSLEITGNESFSISGLDTLSPGCEIQMTIHRDDGSEAQCSLLCRLDTDDELSYYNSGGILHYVLHQLTG